MRTRKSFMIFTFFFAFFAIFLLRTTVLASISGTADNETQPEVLRIDQTSALEVSYLDMYEPGNDGAVGPISSTMVLSAGIQYEITISGTFSVWPVSAWATTCKGVEEDWPLIQSPGIANGKVGLDPAYSFAVPGVDTSLCNDPELIPPYRHRRLEISTDNGGSWSFLRSMIYYDNHAYTFIIDGQGYPAQFRYVDYPTDDNYGVLEIKIIRELPVDESLIFIPIVLK